MSPEIQPLWRTRICGIARTSRYLPYVGPIPRHDGWDEYWAWAKPYMKQKCTNPFKEDLVPGDVIVIDQSGADAGLMGSGNTLGGLLGGVRGYVSNGGVRDTDEVIRQKVPFWAKTIRQRMLQPQIVFDGKDVPVCVGGVTVRPGDIIVADGDGVIVVPIEYARDVATYARRMLDEDKAGRRRAYEQLGWELDETVM
jgi:regulator of RNase E activity RraA